MRIGARGQVTIPKPFREGFGLTAATEVEFMKKRSHLILQKKAFNLSKKKSADIM